MKNDKIRDHNELRLSWRSSRRRDRLHRRCPSTPLLVASLKRASSAAIATEALADSTPTHFSTFRMDEHEVDRKRKSPADGDGEKCKVSNAGNQLETRLSSRARQANDGRHVLASDLYASPQSTRDDREPS